MTRPANPHETPPSLFAGNPGGDTPRPSPTLLAHIAKMRPVRTRVPARSLVTVAIVACAYPAWALAAVPFRPDLGSLPVAWVVCIGTLWLAGFIFSLTFAIVPRPGQLVPDGQRALRTAFLTAAVLIGASLLLDVQTFGGRRSATPGAAQALTWHACATAGFRVSLPTIIVGALALRRVAILDSWRLGTAVGAAGGALGGLTLHLGCSNGSSAHVALVHGGGVVLGAILGALCLRLHDFTSRSAGPPRSARAGG